MLPIKKIVCPTDFSDPSYEGLRVAREFAAYFSAELILVNVIFPGPIVPGAVVPGFHIPAALKAMQKTAEKTLKDLTRQKMSEDISARTLAISGKPAYEIVNLADEENADIIVIATHGKSGWSNARLNSSMAESIPALTSSQALLLASCCTIPLYFD
jgi:nucleotide-binding universal stress UspA family protein